MTDGGPSVDGQLSEDRTDEAVAHKHRRNGDSDVTP